MYKMKVYITRKLPSIAKELLEAKGFAVEENLDGVLDRSKLISAVQTYDALLTTIPDILDQEVLKNAKAKVISNYAIGLDNIDLAYAKQKKIAVFNTPGIVTDSTADLAMALLLSFCRRLEEAFSFVKDNAWKEWSPDLLLGDELKGKTLGVVGFGRIGQAVAKRALAFGMQVVFYQRSFINSLSFDLKGCRQVGLDELYQTADFLSLHVPLTEETRGMVDLTAFRKMQKRPLLLNLARGPVVKTADLIVALKEKLIRGAALDVTDPEPLPASHPLLQFDNCIVVPHIGTATRECRTLMAKKAAENIIAFFAANL